MDFHITSGLAQLKAYYLLLQYHFHLAYILYSSHLVQRDSNVNLQQQRFNPTVIPLIHTAAMATMPIRTSNMAPSMVNRHCRSSIASYRLQEETLRPLHNQLQETQLRHPVAVPAERCQSMRNVEVLDGLEVVPVKLVLLAHTLTNTILSACRNSHLGPGSSWELKRWNDGVYLVNILFLSCTQQHLLSIPIQFSQF